VLRISDFGFSSMDAYAQSFEDLRRRALRMGSLVEEMVRESFAAVFANNPVRAEAVVSRDTEVDTEEVEIEREVLSLLQRRSGSPADLRLLCTVLKSNADLERIADCAVNIAQRVRGIDRRIPTAVEPHLRLMDGLVRRMLREAIAALGSQDLEPAHRVLREEETADALHEQIIQKLTADMAQSPQDIIPDLDLVIIVKNAERIADHATNIAEDAVYLVTGEIIRHRFETDG